MGPQIITIINFVRAVEPRDPRLDLVEPVRNQLSLLRRHGLPGTFLLQFDSLHDPRFLPLMHEAAGARCEIGAWLEIVQPLVEKAGIPWRGRPGYAWDWHAHVGFSVGYTPRERESLVDVFMRDFKETFGAYPQSVGSWIIDAHTLAYLSDRYGATASCNCKDQWGTDGYTLWGGYVNQAYYPSRANALSPAQSDGNQIPLPVFRMLGSDPLYQYDTGFVDADIAGAENGQPVVTLEPVYAGSGETAACGGGGNPEWVRWFFKTVMAGPNLSFGYAQVGQENSFGWKAMRRGIEDQLSLIAEKRKAGEVRVECLRDTARWYRERYPHTPASVTTALTDWKGKRRRTVWYCSRFYRVNVFQEAERVWVRDMHLFDDQYPERYLNDVCRGESLTYDNLPVIDGSRWSGNGVRAGMYLTAFSPDGRSMALPCGSPAVAEGSEELAITWPLAEGGTCVMTCTPRSVSVAVRGGTEGSGWGLQLLWDSHRSLPLCGVSHDGLRYRSNDWPYRLDVGGARITRGPADGEIQIIAEKDEILLTPGAAPRTQAAWRMKDAYTVELSFKDKRGARTGE